MRILHTADWHAGRTLHGADRTPEVRAALEELAEIALSERVDVVVWPVLGEPHSAHGHGVARSFSLARQRRDWVGEELPAFLAGQVAPKPGFHCRTCPVFDLCREGVRQ